MSIIPFTKYKLRIACMTYNHASYIEDAMNGFCMQNTNFPFVAIIFDDASTDGEADIIRKYLDYNFDMSHAKHEENEDAEIISAIHKENKNCHFLVALLKYNFWGAKKAKYPLIKGWYNDDIPYVAVCEGDDYWTDSHKLQKQVDYLEAHPECGLIYTDFDIYVQRSGKLKKDMIKTGQYHEIKSFEEHLLKATYIAPPSWLYKIDKNVFYEINNNPHFVDSTFSLALEFLKNSHVHFMEDTTCVYRMLDNSASHHTSLYKHYLYAKGIFEEQLYFGSKYNVNPDILKSIRTKFYRKYYAQILSYEDHEEIERLKQQVGLFDDSNYKTKLIKLILSSRLLSYIYKFVCKYRYKKA